LTLTVNGHVYVGSQASGWFASPSGTAGGAGTIGSPWDLQTALNGGYPANTIQPGDTVNMRGGVYYGTAGAGGKFQLNISGVVGSGVDHPGGKIIFRSYPGEWAIIDPINPGTGHAPGSTGMTVILGLSGNYVWFRDFEIRSSDTSRVTTDTGSFPAQIIAWNQGGTFASNTGYGVGCKAIHIVGHDTIGGTSFGQDAVGAEIYGCINYYNGWLVSVGGDRNHGHNTYCQSDTSQTQQCCLYWASADDGCQIYGGAGPVVGYNFNKNIIFESGAIGPANGYYTKSPNLVANAGTFHDNTFDGNCQYTYGGAAYPSPALGTTDSFGGTANVAYTNNYVVNGAYSQLQFVHNPLTGILTATGNTFATGYVVDYQGFDANDSRSLLYDDAYRLANTYYSLTKPTTNFIKVIPVNKYEVGRGHIAVYNWQGLGSVNVDISSFMPNGSTYAVYAGQNPLGAAIATGTYNGGTISLSTAAQTVATPSGLSAIGATGPEFNTYIVKRT
jgi:hypothetical protein